jgi:AcrR family transcriptional regulator
MALKQPTRVWNTGGCGKRGPQPPVAKGDSVFVLLSGLQTRKNGMNVSTKAKRPTLRKLQQAATREKLIKASYESFSSQGYSEATINDIVERAGTSRATFYVHFQCKSEALSAAWREIQQNKMNTLWQHLNQTAPWTKDSIQAWMDQMIASWENDAQFSLASNQAVALDPVMAEAWFGGITDYWDLVPNILAALDADNATAKIRFLLLCAQMDRAVFMWLSGNFKGNRTQLLEGLSDFWSTMLIDHRI